MTLRETFISMMVMFGVLSLIGVIVGPRNRESHNFKDAYGHSVQLTSVGARGCEVKRFEQDEWREYGDQTWQAIYGYCGDSAECRGYIRRLQESAR